MTTPTPRTDAKVQYVRRAYAKGSAGDYRMVDAEFARQLERELAAAQEENAKLREACAAGWGEPALINTLRAELASVKAERDALKERIWQIRVELGALFTMLPNEVPGLAMEVCERDADRQCLFRAFELAAHKVGA